MSLFLQNAMGGFAAAGAVEAAVGHLEKWNMSRRGGRTMVVWNHADPVLEEYAPKKSEPAYYNLTVNTLRRSGSTMPNKAKQLLLSDVVTQADLLYFAEETDAPELQIVSWTSQPGQHTWASALWTGGLDAASHLVHFFMFSDEHLLE